MEYLGGLTWTRQDGKEAPFDLPPKTRFEDVVDSIGRHIDQYPEQRTNPTALIVGFSLMEDFPNSKRAAGAMEPRQWPARPW